MGRIQSSIGLITGVPIADTVDQLIALSARPRDLLVARNEQLLAQQVAVNELTALTIAIQLASDKLGDAATFQQRDVTSSDSSLLAATLDGEPALGTYQFTPIRRAQNHQVVSSGVSSLDEELGTGSLSLRFGGFVDQGLQLDLLNGGAGIQRGKIRVTDRSGANAIVDLRFAQSIDDVVSTINKQEAINVTAVAVGDRLRLVDNTGQTVSNLKVQEVGGGRTAADLGLGGVDVAAGQADGADVLRLYEDLSLQHLNDGSGLSIRDELPDLEISFRDNSTLQVDFHAGEVNESTLGELLETLNTIDPARLRAEIGPSGDALVLTDLTGPGGGTFEVRSSVGGTLAEDLGLTGAAAADVISGSRLLGGLKTTLLSSLSGGFGLGTLGQLDLTDRAGTTDSVDLSSAQTLQDVTDAINGANVAITARINSARHGIELVDTSGAVTSNLIVANGDATNTADKLQIAVNGAQISSNSGSLDRQTFHESLLLSELNGGQGVSLGSFLITDTLGKKSAVGLAQIGAKTVGDVLEAINGLDIGVEARINSTGDGILLVDTALGSGKITVADTGSNATAAELRISGQSTSVDLNGTPTEVIDGSYANTIQIEAGDTLSDLQAKLDALDAPVAVSILNDGLSEKPYHLSLVSEVTGRRGELLVDVEGVDLNFQEISRAQDALLLVGSLDSASAGLFAASSDNTFDELIEGVSLTIAGTSTSPVTVTVDSTDESLTSQVQLFVDQYNKLQDKIDDLTFFNESDNSTGLLFGSLETLRIESGLAGLVTGRFSGAGAIQSLEILGVGIGETGQLNFDSDALAAKFLEDPDAVEEFFTSETFGFSARVNELIEQLAGEGNSLLINRNEALQGKIDQNSDRIEFMSGRLERERVVLLKQFYNMERAIAGIQANLSAVQSLQPIPPLVSV